MRTQDTLEDRNTKTDPHTECNEEGRVRWTAAVVGVPIRVQASEHSEKTGEANAGFWLLSFSGRRGSLLCQQLSPRFGLFVK